MAGLIRERSFYRELFMIALPIAAQNTIGFAVSMADTVMLGMLGEIELSAAAQANQLSFILMIIGFGVASAANVFTAQYWGKGDTGSIRAIITIMLRVVFVLALAATCVAFFLPEQFMTLYSKDAAVIRAGADYLRVAGWGYILYSMVSVTLCVLRSVHTVKISVVVYLISLVVNVFFNWVFIFGRLGAPAMGVRGAALATVLARVAEFAILLYFLAAKEHKIHYRFSHLLMPTRAYIRAFIKTGIPVILNETFWSIGTSALSMIIGLVGTEFVAANSIANVVWQLVSVLIMGIGSATAVVIGNAVGRGEPPKLVKQKANTVTALSFALGLLSAGLLLLLRPVAIEFYNVAESTKELAYDLMVSYSIVVLFQGLTMQYIVGVLRGGGDTKFAMFADVFFLWTVSIPLGYLVGVRLGWAPPLVYLVLKSDEIIKTVVCTWRIQCTRWVKDITVPGGDVPES